MAVDLYEGYSELKGWAAAGPADHGLYFDAVAAEAGLPAPARLLEIGFGAGHCLAWARARGHAVAGIEILPDRLAAARADGFDVHAGPLRAGQFPAGSFDGVFAFDVLEHLPPEEIVATMRIVHGLLKESGVLVVRFPDCQNPFGLQYQAADITHRTMLSWGAFVQLCGLTGFEPRRMGAERVLPPGGLPRLKQRCAQGVRDVFGLIVGKVVFGKAIGLDPNLTLAARPIPRSGPWPTDEAAAPAEAPA